MKTIKQVLTGYFFWLIRKNQKLYRERTNKCKNCNLLKKTIIKRCGVCGCVLQARNRLKESYCYMERWEK